MTIAHDDHLHVRIACSPEEIQAGCSGGGPYWEWLPPVPVSDELDQAQLDAIAADDPLDAVEPLPVASVGGQ